MIFRSPILALQPYIEAIWYCNRYIANTETTLSLPFGKIEMVINLSGDYLVKYPGLPFEKMDCWIAGQQTAPVLSKISGHHECTGVLFTTLGYNALTTTPAAELANGSAAASEFWGIEISTLIAELHEEKTPGEKLKKLEGFLIRKISVQPQLSTIRQALHEIHNPGHKNKITVTGLCETVKISRNALNKHFRRYIGISASGYLQVRTFNSVIRELSHLPKERLVSVGYDHEFFDQSHFIKHFQRFAGMAPGQYLRFLKNNAIDRSYPNFISCQGDIFTIKP